MKNCVTKNYVHSLMLRAVIALVLVVGGSTASRAQFPASCDVDKSCVGLAYTPTVGTGKGAHYIEVQSAAVQDSLNTSMSVEFWIKATRQPGARVYLGGRWGPYTNNDNNDSWALYITPSDQLAFELNGSGNNLGAADNTLATTDASPLYAAWTHVCAVFDGASNSAIIYLNGQEVGRNRNAAYPITTLRRPSDPSLKILFGSTNDIARSTSYRNFIGQLDEIRMWKSVLTPTEIYCNMERSLAGNETGIVLYYRCNDNNSGSLAGLLCDATGKGSLGRMVNMITCQASTRTVQQKLVVSTTAITDEVKCVTQKSWQITITDTSYLSCGRSYSFAIAGRDARFFRVTPTSSVMQPNTPVGLTVTFTGSVTGAIQAQLNITGNNRCMAAQKVDFNLNRSTEVELKKRSIAFDTVFAKCRNAPYHDSLVVVCNNTLPAGTNTNRSIVIRGGSFARFPGVFSVLPPRNKSFPFSLGPGQCDTLRIRFYPTVDTTFAYVDTLTLQSDDNCPGTGIMAVSGVVQEVFSIRQPDGKTRLKSITFQSTCPGDISNSVGWNWYNLTRRDITIDSIYIPKSLVTVGMPRVPPVYTLRPAATNGEFQKYFRFRPLAPGLVNNDPIIFFATLKGIGCQFIDTLRWSGYGRDNDVIFSTPGVDFGNVIVGKDSTMSVTITNKSATDVMNIALYLKTGDAFVFTGAKTASLAPGQSQKLTVTFRPTLAQLYTDELCLFESRCYTTQCIPVRGRGIIERFRFNPPVMNIENVIGCRDSISFVDIVNESSVAQTLKNFTLTQPGTQFTPVDQSGAPINLSSVSISLNPGESKRFYFRFSPNTFLSDVAIVAYLNYTTSLTGDKWMVKLFGSSVIPRIYITPRTLFGTLEVGDTRRDSVTLENTSPLTVYVDSISVPNGYKLISLNKTLPRWMAPRDSVKAIIEFAPVTAGVYNDSIVAKGENPCPQIISKGSLEGKTQIVKLEASLSIQNFSYVRPCDCITRQIPLTNNSFVNNITVDSMWIDSTGIANGTPNLFTWTSYYYEKAGRVLPFSIPPRSTDTVNLVFCPRTPAVTNRVTCVARFNVTARGAGWGPDKYTCFLAGKRSLIFRPLITAIGFPGTRVDTLSIVRRDTIAIPTVVDNPGQETVQIDSITYLPDERVFIHRDTSNQPINFPVVLQPGTKAYPFTFYFKPRAPRQGSKKYSARAVIHYSKPCNDVDTTILLTGEGLAPAFGLQMTFDNKRVETDTFRIISCDTLRVPVYCSRDIPAPTVDVQFDALFDTTKLVAVGAVSSFKNPSFKPLARGGAQFSVKDCKNLDSLQSFVTMLLVPKANVRSASSIAIDSVFFDTQEILNYYLSAGGDQGDVLVDQVEVRSQRPLVDFDSVRVLDCASDTILVTNTGDVPTSVDSLLILPPLVRYLSSVPPRTALLAPGASAVVTVEYCPRDKSSFDSLMYVFATTPCLVGDSLRLKGKGFVPDLPIRFATDNANFTKPAPLGGIIGDTIVVPVYLDTNLSITYRNKTYWLNDLSFNIGASWNKYMLKYLDHSSVFGTKCSVTQQRFDSLTISFNGVDSVRAGKIAALRFLIMVPDTAEDDVIIRPDSVFTTDSLLFINLIPSGSVTQIQTGAKCNTTTAKSSVAVPMLYSAQPNPARDRVTLRFDIQEWVPVWLYVVNTTGEIVATPLDGKKKFMPGQHSVEVDLSDLPPGVYSYVLSAGIFSDTKRMVIVR